MGIPHSAFLSVIFGMMLLSFPIGMFIVFHSDIGTDINFEIPLAALNEFEGSDLWFLSNIRLGDVFVILWSTYAILFAIAILGPKIGFMRMMSSTLSRTDVTPVTPNSNYMVVVIKWFSIIVLISAIVNFVQEGFGIATIPPPIENDLVQFFNASISPLIEEVGFRVILIGIPLTVLYSHQISARHFFKSLWNPNANLNITNQRNALILIILAGVLFGLAHIVTGTTWSEGKFAQATISGIILGWIYLRFGFIVALLIHWATNYFIFAYANFLAQVNDITTNASFSHSLFTTMEVLFLASGILSIVVIMGNYYISRCRPRLEL